MHGYIHSRKERDGDTIKCLLTVAVWSGERGVIAHFPMNSLVVLRELLYGLVTVPPYSDRVLTRMEIGRRVQECR